MNLKLVSLMALCGAFAAACGDSSANGGGGNGSGGEPQGGDGGGGNVLNTVTTTMSGMGGEGAGTPGCYDEELALILPGTVAEIGQDVCDQAQIDGFLAACFDPGTKATCMTFVDEPLNAECVVCINWEADEPVTPALLTFEAADGSFLSTSNIYACNAMALDLPACAIPFAALQFCLTTACDCETDAEFGDCADFAVGPDGICNSVATLDPSCEPLLTAPLDDLCAGTTFQEQYQSVASYFCGPPIL